MATAVQAIKYRRSANQWGSVTPMSEIPTWYVQALETVERLARLSANWDGYGSLDIQLPAKTAALELMPVLSLYRAEAPHIAPVSGGGLQFEWDFEGRQLEVEIRPTGEIEFLTADGTEDMLEGPMSDPWKQVPLLLQWLRTGNFEVTWSYLEHQYATSRS
jgi:hypothetical protein